MIGPLCIANGVRILLLMAVWLELNQSISKQRTGTGMVVVQVCMYDIDASLCVRVMDGPNVINQYRRRKRSSPFRQATKSSKLDEA